MLFVGEFPSPVDARGRVTIPRPFRRKMTDTRLIMTIGHDRTIEVHTPAEWDEHIRHLVENAPDEMETRRSYLPRLLFSQAWEVEPDSQGRIVLPRHLREYAGLTDEVVATGMGCYFELWEPKRCQEFLSQAVAKYDKYLRRLDGLPVGDAEKEDPK
jgi:MraZ protein